MKVLRRSMIPAMLAAVILAAFVQQASAGGLTIASLLGKSPILLGTTGDCNNLERGGDCTQTSTLVQLDPRTGKLIRTIGPVGYTVNGLAWDRTSFKLYATTAAGDVKFHGLITINPFTGQGRPVDATVDNFGLTPGERSPIHSISVDVFGHMVGWYSEFPKEDTYVRINQRTGIATEFPTVIATPRNGLSFGEFNLLWNIDGTGGIAYLLNPFDGKPLDSTDLVDSTKKLLSDTPASLGDFHPGNNLYYGINHDQPVSPTTFIVTVDVLDGTVTTLGQTVDDLHTLAFIP